MAVTTVIEETREIMRSLRMGDVAVHAVDRYEVGELEEREVAYSRRGTAWTAVLRCEGDVWKLASLRPGWDV